MHVMPPACIEEHLCSMHIGMNEGGVVDERSIHMTFSREVQDRGTASGGLIDGRFIGNIAVKKGDSVFQARQIGGIPTIGQQIKDSN